MASDCANHSDWWLQPPSAFDIVTAYFPETNPKGELKLRPCLILDVLKSKSDERFACRIAYGTKNIKFVQRKDLDLIIQNATHLDEMGLPYATRFDLDSRNIVVLPWDVENFGCWRGYPTPRISFLPEEYIKNYAYLMALRQATNRP
ncbi:hypothetical protein J5N58_16915 [Rhizobium cremeum]|uniref:hypothetical protein n=1 Tax=Rhizobium cremeum TaxID=2813827 RepID=UPI0013B01170|nr:hypothetical protein [Rhizobium cremeum]MCJ7996101.1 hypothetical protein [Rhizobium cremeum]MCJ8001360.1 hypothetical protein [Rhizobium cremeum]